MIKIIYDNKVIASPDNLRDAQDLCKSYIQLMLDGKLDHKELILDITQTNPQTLKTTRRRIIIKESITPFVLPHIQIASIDQIAQNDLSLPNRDK